MRTRQKKAIIETDDMGEHVYTHFEDEGAQMYRHTRQTLAKPPAENHRRAAEIYAADWLGYTDGEIELMESRQVSETKWAHEIHRNPLAMSKREIKAAVGRENLRARRPV